MALFGSKKNTKQAAPKAEKAPKAAAQAVVATKADVTSVIRRARITEKASDNQVSGVYVFEIASSATKRDVMKAVTAIYKVAPRAVRIAKIPVKTIRSMRTGKSGRKGGGKKAYVYLKQGDSINL